MKRRTFCGSIAAMSLIPSLTFSSVSQDSSGIPQKPKALIPGDSVGIIAPGTAVSDPDDLNLVKELLNYLGLKYRFGSNVIKGTGYKTRTIDERVNDIHEMFVDKDIKAVFCIRGGYGSPQLLNHLDYDLIRSNPKIFLGYSDITAMHIAIGKHSNLVTFHGPVMLSSFTKFTYDYFYKALFDTNPIGIIKNSESKGFIRETFPVRTIKSGKAQGRLTGGNLSLIAATMGTPYEIETEGRILCIEDVDEEPFRIDRMLTQLDLAGKLKSAAGIVFGRCTGCDGNKLEPSKVWDYSLGEVLDSIFGKYNIPSFYGLNFGHTSEQATLPFGCLAEIDSDLGIINVMEGGVV
jgi:muramoyltetrapeptide carboxypeptidase